MKRLLLLVAVLCLICGSALALSFDNPPEVIRPGRLIRLGLSADSDGEATVLLLDESAHAVCTLKETVTLKDCSGYFTWDGMTDGTVPAPGSYYLYAQMGEELASATITIGEKSPSIDNVTTQAGAVVPGDEWSMNVNCNMAGRLCATLDDDTVLLNVNVHEGENELFWSGSAGDEILSPGVYPVTLRLYDETGYSSTPQLLNISVSAIPTGTTVSGITTYNTMLYPSDLEWQEDGSFWTLEMGILDEEAIWNALMQPITVVDSSDQRALFPIYEKPSTSSKIMGEVTGFSQGLHILETRSDGWTLVQCYSSSTEKSKSNNYAGFCEGYIQSNLLKTRSVNPTYAILVDKLTQTLYLFKNGKIVTTLLVSTGKATKEKPFNETVAGEYIIASRTGGFWSGNMYCDMALRVNGGCLLHEVPCLIGEDGARYYSTFEAALGTKASHGCIRVQRKSNEDGYSQTWLWNNIKVGTKIVIWEDTGRTFDIPDDDTPMYYNPNGGSYYHSDQYCSSVKKKYLPLQEFCYGELEDSSYAKLKPCPHCKPPKRIDELIELNRKNNSK